MTERPIRRLQDPVRSIAEAFPWIADGLREIIAAAWKPDADAAANEVAFRARALLNRLEGKGGEPCFQEPRDIGSASELPPT